MKRWKFMFLEQINNINFFARSGMANNIRLLIFPHDLIFMTKNNERKKNASLSPFDCFRGNHGNRMINKQANLLR